MRTITSPAPFARCLTEFATAATRRLSAGILAAAVLAAVPALSDTGSLRAQGSLLGCLKCIHHRLFDREDLHWTKSGVVPENGYGYGDGVHNNVPAEGNCDVVHGVCVNVPRLTARELTRQISDAVAANDIAALARLATMPLVDLYTDRSAMQVLGCDGETIAGHVPVGQTLLAAIKAATVEIIEPDA